MKIISRQGQWLGDIAVREAGSIEAVIEMAVKNNISITGKLALGTELLKPTPINRRVMNYYEINKIFPATSYEWKRKPVVMVFTENGVFEAPGDVDSVEVFAVGGGGAGKEGYVVFSGRNGGSGGQVITQTVPVVPGVTYPVTIGGGGPGISGSGVVNGSAAGGGSTTFGDLVTALGGLGGFCTEQSIQGYWAQPVVYNSATGGSRLGGKYNGEDGQCCPFDLSAFPDLNGRMFGAGGGACDGMGGNTGGGVGQVETVTAATSGSFYGAGGGGGGYNRGPGGSGYQGILIIKY
jgi:hypothetical protein